MKMPHYNEISSNLTKNILKHNEYEKRSCEWKPISKTK